MCGRFQPLTDFDGVKKSCHGKLRQLSKLRQGRWGGIGGGELAGVNVQPGGNGHSSEAGSSRTDAAINLLQAVKLEDEDKSGLRQKASGAPLVLAGPNNHPPSMKRWCSQGDNV